jgi:hypothetical protein
VDAVKSLLRWFAKGIAEHAREAVIVALLGFGAVATAIDVVRRWLAEQAVCMIQGACTITGPRLTVLVLGVYLVVFASGVLAVMLWRSRATTKLVQRQLTEATARLRPPPFEEVPVEDKRYHLRWFIKRPPSEWLDWDAIYNYSPELIANVIGGPLHAEGCNGRLREDWSQQKEKGPAIDPECPVCGVQLWNPLTEDYEPTRIRLFDTRWGVLQTLQRQCRNGTALTSAVVLDKPEYWKAMTPAARVPQRS